MKRVSISILSGAAFSTILLVIYITGLAPSVNVNDCGELAAVCYTLGIAHPSGYPTYTILGWLWSKIPIGSEVYRLNLLSAVLCAAGAFFLYRFVYCLLGSEVRKKPNNVQQNLKKKKISQAAHRSSAALVHRTSEPLKIVLSLFGSGMIALSANYMASALTTEVYALHCFFLGTILLAFIFAALRTEFDKPTSWSNTRVWYPFALLLGLSFTNHLSTIFLAPALLFFFFVEHKNITNSSKRAALLFPLFLAGLLPYLYMPIRASFDPTLNWGNPNTLESFLRHISGHQYRARMFSSTEVSVKNFIYYFENLPSNFGYLPLLLSPVGLIYLLRFNWKLGVLNILLFGGCLLYSINYNIPDIGSYFLLADIAVGIWIMFGVLVISRILKKHRLKIVLAFSVICLSAVGITSFKKVNQTGNYMIEDYVMNMFDSLEENAIIITYQWAFLTSPSYYYQHVKGIRPDVVIIDKELLQLSWYCDQLNHLYPEIMVKVKPQVDIFLREMDKFIRGVTKVTPEGLRKYYDVIQAIVDTNIQNRPVYFTTEMFTGRDKDVAKPYLYVPQGLAYRLYKEEPAELTPAFSDLRFRNFDRSGYPYDKIKEHQAVMLQNRAYYLFIRHNMIDEALKIVDHALTISPDNKGVQECKKRIMKAKMSTDG